MSRRDDKNASGPPSEPPGPPVPDPLAGERPPAAEDAPTAAGERPDSGADATGAKAEAKASGPRDESPGAEDEASGPQAEATGPAAEPSGAAAADAPEPPSRAAPTERTPALEVAATLRDLDMIADEDEEDERTVEALGLDAFGEASPEGFGVPTRRAEQEALDQLTKSLEQEGDEFSQEHTTVATLDGRRLDKAAADSESAEQRSSAGETYYRDLVREEISFSRATGYDREGTAVVPLAELARREEDKLCSDGLDAEAAGEEAGARRNIPVGEIIDVLRAARSVEEVAGVLVEIVSNLIPRVLLLWERHGRLFGFASRGMALTEVKLLTIELPRGLLQQMAAAELELDSFQGPPRIEGMVERLFELLGARPPEVLLIPVQVTAADRWLLYADNGDQPLPDFELRLLEVVASRAGARADWLLDRRSLW